MPKNNEKQSKARTLRGVVVGTNMAKTVVVKVQSRKTHRVYGKQYQVSKKYLVHDEKNQCKVGDMVSIGEIRPISKRKRWLVLEKLGKKESQV